jgi:hypothetical protein
MSFIIHEPPFECSKSPTERDSPRDQIIVTLFLLVVIGLLIGAAIKTRMEMMGIDSSSAWTSGRAWWEVSWLSFGPHNYN